MASVVLPTPPFGFTTATTGIRRLLLVKRRRHAAGGRPLGGTGSGANGPVTEPALEREFYLPAAGGRPDRVASTASHNSFIGASIRGVGRWIAPLS
ncbi:hypothetical protein GCM10023089_18120 [Quisquiliibacterium transsilvanicum]